ncbi:MAG TPA: aspartate kinase [Candidatus Hydrogenedentes bacterium]|nr:aspartate kinase [Candidatus Hydrogenedentota bacterium]HPG69824.1 aspartate kinase [Candidatus Hydrogenedentota bacterium]
MGDITCKFGGSSLADAACIRQAEKIIRADSRRRFVVPSAPGKRASNDKKITDLLYAWYNLAKDGLDASQPSGIIKTRFEELASDLGVCFDIAAHLDQITEEVSRHETADYAASRGEYLNGRLMAELLGATFVDPAECIRFDDEGAIDPATYALLGARLQGDGLFVVPGFYGALPNGDIKTFSRGGSDVTGAIVARATNSDLYENWTDVSGFRMADPSIIPDAKRMAEVTYKELRELSYMGAKVLHDEAIFPVREPGIPIHIVNSRDPEAPGTMIVPRRESAHPVCGIAGSKGFTMINIEKALMNRELGFGRRVLTVLEEHGVSFEHMPTGIDTISLIVKDEALANHGPSILKAIERRCEPDRITLTAGLALIATVGQGMNHHIGIAGTLCSALAEAGVNIRVLDQGSSEMNIIIGVEENDFEGAVRAIYSAFDTWAQSA